MSAPPCSCGGSPGYCPACHDRAIERDIEQPSLLAEPMRIQLGSEVSRPRWSSGESVGALVILAAIIGMVLALVVSR